MGMKGNVMQIQNFSVNDGDGIRSTIFLAGCPLRCQWCSNPEGFTQEAKTAWYETTCIGCGKCVAVCPFSIGINLNTCENRKKCIGCGKCADVCPTHSRKRMVIAMDSDEVVKSINPFIQFFRQSGGGITFSGGEATVQKEFLKETAQKLYDLGIDLALETSGYFEFDELKDVLALFETIFVDIKHIDSNSHKHFTNVNNEKILDNIKKFNCLNAEIIVRIPAIEGVNADDDNIRKTAEFIHKELPKAKIEILPYHKYGESKYEALGLNSPPDFFSTPDDKRIKELKTIIEKEGIISTEYK